MKNRTLLRLSLRPLAMAARLSLSVGPGVAQPAVTLPPGPIQQWGTGDMRRLDGEFWIRERGL